MIDELNEAIEKLTQKKDKVHAEALKFNEEFKRVSAKGEAYENEAEFYWQSRITRIREVERLMKLIEPRFNALSLMKYWLSTGQLMMRNDF